MTSSVKRGFCSLNPHRKKQKRQKMSAMRTLFNSPAAIEPPTAARRATTMDTSDLLEELSPTARVQVHAQQVVVQGAQKSFKQRLCWICNLEGHYAAKCEWAKIDCYGKIVCMTRLEHESKMRSFAEQLITNPRPRFRVDKWTQTQPAEQPAPVVVVADVDALDESEMEALQEQLQTAEARIEELEEQLSRKRQRSESTTDDQPIPPQIRWMLQCIADPKLAAEATEEKMQQTLRFCKEQMRRFGLSHNIGCRARQMRRKDDEELRELQAKQAARHRTFWANGPLPTESEERERSE